jgi:hypothetical protein
MCGFGASYQVAKDFLPSIITLIAAGTAAWITWHFSRHQAVTARRQADIAHDRLRFDLFEKRYAIYDTTKNVMRIAINDRRKPNFGAFDVVPFLVIIDEAAFFFPKEICGLLEIIKNDIQKLLEVDGLRNANPTDDHVAWTASGNEVYQLEKKIAEALKNMPQLFASAFSFPQLTGHVPDLLLPPPARLKGGGV